MVAIPAAEWSRIYRFLLGKGLLTPKDIGILKVAMQIPARVPTEKQSLVLLDILDRGKMEGVIVDGSGAAE